MTNYERHFQVYNESTHRWILFDRTQGRVVDIKDDGEPYENIPKYNERIK